MSSPARTQPLERGDRALAWAVFLALCAVYIASFSGLPDNPDSEVEFQTTSALARRHSFALGGTNEATAITTVIHQGRLGFNVHKGGPGREQEFFSWSGVGQALVALPFYAAGALLARSAPALEERNTAGTHINVHQSEYCAHLVVGLRNPLLGALTGALLFVAALRSGARRSFALLCALSYGLCSYAWPQARGTLSDVQATAFLFLAFVLGEGVCARVAREERTRVVEALGFGLALGGAFLTRLVLAPGVAVLALFYLARLRGARRARFPWRELALGYLPALACFAFFLWVNWLRFGNALESGYGGVVGTDWFKRSPWIGLVGVTVSPGSGLLWLAPALVLVPLWFVRAWRDGERFLPGLIAALLATIGLLNTIIPSWTGAWSYGPRYLLPLIPFLWFPLGLAFERAWERTLGRVLVVALVALGFVTALGGVLVEYNTDLDLSAQASKLAWPELPGVDADAQGEDRFVRAKFDWRFAAPWAHWRILFHRLAGEGESFPVRELYFLDSDQIVTPSWKRYEGFHHLGWVDLVERLDGPAWPGPLLCLALLGGAFTLAHRARRSTLEAARAR